jgi:hypothetical protein
MTEKEQLEKENATYLNIMKEVVNVKLQRNENYTIEPRTVLPIEALDGMLLTKAMRIFYAKNKAHKRDDLIDIINYAAFIIEREDLDALVLPKIQESIDRVRRKQKNDPKGKIGDEQK